MMDFESKSSVETVLRCISTFCGLNFFVFELVSVSVSNVDYSEAVGRQTKPALVITQCNCRELGGKGLVSSLNTQPCLANRPPWQNVIWKDMILINLFSKFYLIYYHRLVICCFRKRWKNPNYPSHHVQSNGS